MLLRSARADRSVPGRARGGAAVLALAAGLGLGGAAGCAPKHGDLVGFLRAHESEVASGQYLVRPPDELVVHAPGAPEVDGTVQRVRSDGKIVLRLLGEVEVAGLSTHAVAEKLRVQLSRYYVEPEVLVAVTEARSQHYYIVGQVEAPGPKPFTGRDTLLCAVTAARPNFLAWRSQVRVTRPSSDARERRSVVVDLDAMVSSGDVSADFLLQEGDIVEVPPTPLGWVGLRMRELLYPFTPALSAYSAPADVIDANETYQNHGDDGNNDHRSPLRR